MTDKELLIIFYRNPELGKVKTRLAVTVGQERALFFYHKLVAHTQSLAKQVAVDRTVYYSNFIEEEDIWESSFFRKALQHRDSLGSKMSSAFQQSFDLGYRSVCIIGTDCFELSTSVVEDAFKQLKNNDAVIGPAKDGGYYLLGMNKMIPQVFENKHWSTATVLADTLGDFQDLRLSYAQLPTLSDVDREEDLPQAWRDHHL